MRKSNFIKKGISLMFAGVMMLALATPMADSRAQNTTDNSYDVSGFRKEGSAYTYPSKKGYVFAGWYTDSNYQTPLGTDVTQGEAYAKFVSEDVLRVKYQLPVEMSDTDTTTSLRLVTSVDSINYQYVGFKVEYTDNGATQTRKFQTKHVYHVIKGNVDGRVTIKYKSGVFSDASTYLTAITINKMPMAIYNSGLIVTPQWVTLDGTAVTGESRNLKDEQASGTASDPLTAGWYAADTEGFVATEGTGTSVTGKDGTQGGAFATKHGNGPYIVLKGYDFGTNDFIISTWFKVPTSSVSVSGSETYLFGISHANATEGFSVYLDALSPRVKVNGVTVIKLQGSICTKGTWHNIVLSRKDHVLELRFDDKEVGKYSLENEHDFEMKDLAFGGYYGDTESPRPGHTVHYDDIEMTMEELKADSTIGVPEVNITYADGTIANSGTDSTLTVGAYALEQTPNATKFVETTDVAYTTGMENDANGALSMIHKTGAYTVVKGYDFGIDDFTISTWFNVPTSSSDASSGSGTYLFGTNHPDASDGFSVCMKKNVIRLRIDGENIMPKVSYSKGTWNNVVLVCKGKTMELYFNGTRVHRVTRTTKDFDFGMSELAFGGYYGFAHDYAENTMYYDNIQVYGKALTAEQINSLYSK